MRYTGSVYTGVAGSEFQQGAAYRSIAAIARRPGDGEIRFLEYTKGQDAREHMVKEFLGSSHDWLLFLDGDMDFPEFALERLRCHGLPCVSGLYFRRQYPDMFPIWFEDDPAFQWPMQPFTTKLEPHRLYPLGATGFGIWLIHRAVFEAVAPLLKGEPFVWEDDLDVWPYDLARVLKGEESLRPLRGTKDRIGADLRLSFFIRQAGFTLWGDPMVGCGHYHPFPINIHEWEATRGHKRSDFPQQVREQVATLRVKQQEKRKEVFV